MVFSSTRIYHRKVPKNLRSPRRTKLPSDFGVNLFLKKPRTDSTDTSHTDIDDDDFTEEESGDKELDGGGVVWEEDEIEAISSLFQGRIPRKPEFLYRERPLPLPLPYKLRLLGMCKKVYKNPSFLINLAREIKGLSSNEDVCVVLDKCARFLRKGSLSLTIRELGHMALPERALQTFCWAQKQPHLFPDDRILASTVEVLARHHELKMPFNLEKFSSLASGSVLEAMVRGFIIGGNLKLALKLLWVAKNNNRMLDPSIYAKLILGLIENPDRHVLVDSLLDELAQRENLNLNQLLHSYHESWDKAQKIRNRGKYIPLVHTIWARSKRGYVHYSDS